MYEVNDILARLQKGESPETIANECAQALNAAMELDKKQKEAELQKQKEAELQKAKAAEKEAKLNKYAEDMAAAMLNYFTVLDPEVIELMDEENVFDVKEVRETLDASYATIKSMLALAGVVADKKPASLSDADASIAKFLKSFGL